MRSIFARYLRNIDQIFPLIQRKEFGSDRSGNEMEGVPYSRQRIVFPESFFRNTSSIYYIVFVNVINAWSISKKVFSTAANSEYSFEQLRILPQLYFLRVERVNYSCGTNWKRHCSLSFLISSTRIINPLHAQNSA
jgi:hypothetical protein